MEAWFFLLAAFILYQLVLRICLWKARWKAWDKASFGYRLAETQLIFSDFLIPVSIVVIALFCLGVNRFTINIVIPSGIGVSWLLAYLISYWRHRRGKR